MGDSHVKKGSLGSRFEEKAEPEMLQDLANRVGEGKLSVQHTYNSLCYLLLSVITQARLIIRERDESHGHCLVLG